MRQEVQKLWLSIMITIAQSGWMCIFLWIFCNLKYFLRFLFISVSNENGSLFCLSLLSSCMLCGCCINGFYHSLTLSHFRLHISCVLVCVYITLCMRTHDIWSQYASNTKNEKTKAQQEKTVIRLLLSCDINQLCIYIFSVTRWPVFCVYTMRSFVRSLTAIIIRGWLWIQ